MFSHVPILVGVVEHNAILIEGIICLIRSEPDMKIAGTARTPEEGTALYLEKRPEVILIDLDLPGGSPIDAIRQIRNVDSSARVIALTTYEFDSSGLEAMAAGAAAVIAKSRIAETLTDSIRAACRLR